MLNKSLILFSILFFTGCVERGYELTVNKNTDTITAVKSVEIDTKRSTKTDMETMNNAVSKEQTKQINEKKIKEPKKHKPKKIIRPQEELETLKNKQMQEKEAQRLAAEKERVALAEKLKKEKEAEEKKQALERKQIKDKQEKEALNKKLAKEKAERIRKQKDEKEALERKLAEQKRLQAEKENEERIALQRKLAEEKALKEKEKAKQAALKKAEAERLKKEEAKRKLLAASKTPVATAESLIFKPSTQTYQKFGTSEIHGHVVYMNKTGSEIGLRNTKVYLVPQNTKTDHWYENYYLKNKEASSLSKTTVQYMNATHLNLEKNFTFYGLATGTYYIIIESDYPTNIAKNKKVYIAKKINVEKYKKIMTVFSKKL